MFQEKRIQRKPLPSFDTGVGYIFSRIIFNNNKSLPSITCAIIASKIGTQISTSLIETTTASVVTLAETLPVHCATEPFEGSEIMSAAVLGM